MKGSPKEESVFKSYLIKIKVSDGYKSVEEEFEVTVTPTLILIM